MSIIVKQDTSMYSLLYFCKLLHIFRVVTPPIIRSTNSVIKKDGLNFVRLYFLNYTWYVNDLHNI